MKRAKPILLALSIMLGSLLELHAADTAAATACNSSGDTDSISVTVQAARNKGVAPLGVFLDASGTISKSTSLPFHELEYRWNFGDAGGSPESGLYWQTGSRPGSSSRNEAAGPLAAHVYERPGKYTVELQVLDGKHRVTSKCIHIDVQDPADMYGGNKTICVAAATMPVAGESDCPAGAQVVQQASFSDVIGKFARTGRRILFRRGDIFTASSEPRIVENGPGTIGAYGRGAQPIIQLRNKTDEPLYGLSFSSRGTPHFHDWRVMDLQFDGMGHKGNVGVGIGQTSGGLSQVTLLRITARNMDTAFGFGGDLLNFWNNNGFSGHSIDQLFIVDSTSIAGPNTVTSCYNAGNRVAFLGNSIDGGGNAHGSHVTRFPYLGKAVISNNVLSRPGFDRNIIKLHAPYWNAKVGMADPAAKRPPSAGEDTTNFSTALNGDGYTHQVLIADNKFVDFANPWAVSIGPQDGGKDERVKDVIVERNWFVSAAKSQAFITVWAHQVTIRNNIFAAGSANVAGVMVTQRGIEPPSDGVSIYNNSYFSSYRARTNEIEPIQLGNKVSDITIRNNLAYAPNGENSYTRMIGGMAVSGLKADTNTSNRQLTGSEPGYLAGNPATPADFRLSAGSYALNSGTAVPVWSDFFLKDRPVGRIDMGAIEMQ